MVEVPAGESWLGADPGSGFVGDGEGPRRLVRIRAYAIAAHAVSDDDFAEFVAATGHRTDAEAFVFHSLVAPPRPDGTCWRSGWRAHPGGGGVRGACWSTPFGPGSSLAGLGDHPVVHVPHRDAQAYARWRGGRRPSGSGPPAVGWWGPSNPAGMS